MRSGIWRFTVATQTLYSHAAQKNRNIGAHFPHVQNSPKDDLENLPPVWLLVCTNLFIASPFWTTDTNFDNCCLHYIATCGKIYIGAHLHSLPLPAAVKFSSNLWRIHTNWGAQSFPPIFGLFPIFTSNSPQLWSHLATKMRNTYYTQSPKGVKRCKFIVYTYGITI